MPSLKTLKSPAVPACPSPILSCTEWLSDALPSLPPPGPHSAVSSAPGSFGTPAPGFSSMLYGMKIANLAYVTKTRVRFFGLDRWADVWFPEKRRMKPGLEMSKHHRSLLATIFHDRCACV